MKRILPLTLLLLCFTTYAQHEADKWFFGVNAGLDFSAGPPVAVSGGAMVTNEGCATISDVNGNLLFYTDGVTVWNRNHQVMPNGTGLFGGISSTQSSICIPLPGSTTIYYLFTVDEAGGPNGFCYSIVDMNLQGGNGDVDTSAKNVFIVGDVTEKLTALKQANGDYRIAIHLWGTADFVVYQLTSAGLQPAPVISTTGIVHNNSAIQNTYGEMKFSPCGDKIAVAIGYQDTVEIFDFDENSGIISNPITIPVGYHVYGIEYSRTGDYLYVSNYDPLGTLVQYDLTSGNAATIIASKTILSSTPDIYALQIANDGRIYVTRSFSSFLGIINFPNTQGIGCNYVDNGVDLDPQFTGVTSSLGLPAFIQSIFHLELDCTPSGINTQASENEFQISPNPVHDLFDISIPKESEAILFIYDALGKMVFKKKFSGVILQKHELSAKEIGLSEGIFFAILAGEQTIAKKFICVK
ncbi:MAG: hypothetical protein ABI763_07555 [Bacteroidota bacterium]